MNVLFLDSIERETYGGMEEWIRLVSAGLVERGHGVTVAGRPGSEFLKRIEAAEAGVQLLPLEISGDFNPSTIATLTKYLRKHDIKVIVVNFNKDVRLGGLAARLEGDVRVVWSVGLDITKATFIHRFLTPKLVDGVIVPSESLKQQITRLGYIAPEMVTTIPIGVPDRVFSRGEWVRRAVRQRYRLPADCVIAVTVARLVEQKGHRYLLEAVPEVMRVHPNARFLWCGDGPLEASLREQAAKLGATGQVVFAGMLANIDLELGGADLMVHPSIEEPFGIAIVEGMRAGLPIVASNTGGIPEVLGKAGVLVEPRDPPALAQAINAVISDKERCSMMAISARQRFEEKFNVNAMHEHIEQYLSSVVQAEPRHG